MSCYSYISFPNELKAFRLPDIKGKEKDFGIYYNTGGFREDILLFPDFSPSESCIVIIDKKQTTFNDCFKNPYTYEFHVYLPPDYRLINLAKEDLGNKERALKQEKIATEIWASHKHALYAFISRNLNIDEFVEIYTERLNHMNFKLGPPESECDINLREFLNLIMPKVIVDKHKVTIWNK